MAKYRKGNIYQYVDNSNYMITEEYKPEKITERILNPKTEKYEYKTRIVNHKLDWEQEEQKLKQLLQLQEIAKESKK